ncbi:uncharacterized protein LOC105426763 [Pogonomyrmex barbatus]|uniref:Uncharacterized protein LOC105426763 n=1 Tax=Pogonomyrmex barbatus TaxID=144034 RepID=A0A6I9W3P1_9HYME|nr:uncharacterized protein LOC105426763 [Pogonomyrmex barbatus]
MHKIIHNGIFIAAVVLCSFTGRTLASYCYPDYCQNLTHLEPIPGFQCVLTKVQKGEDCTKLKFENTDVKSSKRDYRTIFVLKAYVIDFGDFYGRTTAFNLSVSDINFHRLITRYQNILNKRESACRRIELYGNASHPAPKELHVSCPFSEDTYEGSSYSLEYLAIGDNYAYTGTYVFYVPRHEHFGTPDIQVKTFTPFVYIDITDLSDLSFYIQPLPPKYNVTEYRAWVINNDTRSIVLDTIIPASRNLENIRYKFSAPDGVYFVSVAVLHPECDKYGCANSTTPYIHIKHVSDKLLIMIISLIWIPPVLLYALYHASKLYRKKVLKRMATKPNCLLVYSPTHPSHVNVMAELTKYLQCCSINAMIDIFDIPKTASKDPGLWCNTAFQIADVVLIATSPPTFAKADATIIYRNVDNHLLRLLKENYPRRNKRYYAIHLPYCKPDHIPEEARHFKKFCIPKNLMRLVKTIYGISCLRLITSSNESLLESIKLATMKISEDESNAMKNTEETDDLLPLNVVQETKGNADPRIEERPPDILNGDIIPQSFTTRIDELNLLGETDENKSFVINSAKNDCEFRIDKLNL